MRSVTKFKIFILMVFAIPSLAYAQNEIAWVGGFTQCSVAGKMHLTGVIEREVDFINWLSDKVEDGDILAAKIIDMNGIDFDKQVVVWIIGKTQSKPYTLKLKARVFEGGVLKTDLIETRPNVRLNESLKTQEGSKLGKNPLHIYVTNPQKVKVRSEENGDSLLKRIEFYKSGQSAPFEAWGEID